VCLIVIYLCVVFSKKLNYCIYILFITTNNHVINNKICNRFEKYVFKYAKTGFEFKPLLAIFKADKRHI